MLPRVESYRPDIDGLRALAVLTVIAFHGFPEYLAGGFVGVDVFFVISGFLISGIILDETRVGTFSLQRFYARRVRRIFPALLLVLAFSLVAGCWLLLPADLSG
jgi:peptidoglycan/LPS O-acetylase OafA/YrhL